MIKNDMSNLASGGVPFAPSGATPQAPGVPTSPAGNPFTGAQALPSQTSSTPLGSTDPYAGAMPDIMGASDVSPTSPSGATSGGGSDLQSILPLLQQLMQMLMMLLQYLMAKEEGGEAGAGDPGAMPAGGGAPTPPPAPAAPAGGGNAAGPASGPTGGGQPAGGPAPGGAAPGGAETGGGAPSSAGGSTGGPGKTFSMEGGKLNIGENWGGWDGVSDGKIGSSHDVEDRTNMLNTLQSNWGMSEGDAERVAMSLHSAQGAAGLDATKGQHSDAQAGEFKADNHNKIRTIFESMDTNATADDFIAKINSVYGGGGMMMQ